MFFMDSLQYIHVIFLFLKLNLQEFQANFLHFCELWFSYICICLHQWMQMHILLVLFAKISVAKVPVKYIVLFLVLLSLYLTDVQSFVYIGG